jgi:hypothetical protein
LGDLSVNVKIILKWIIKNSGVRVCISTHLDQDKVQCRTFVNSINNFVFIKGREFLDQ